jgi:hypothetical protein
MQQQMADATESQTADAWRVQTKVVEEHRNQLPVGNHSEADTRSESDFPVACHALLRYLNELYYYTHVILANFGSLNRYAVPCGCSNIQVV